MVTGQYDRREDPTESDPFGGKDAQDRHGPSPKVRILVQGLYASLTTAFRIPIFATFGAQLQDAQQKQNDRVIIALKEERAAREAKILQRAQEEAQRAAKRALEQPDGSGEASPAVKRARTRSPAPVVGDVSQSQLNVRPNGSASSSVGQPPYGELGTGIGPYFDTTTLGFELATDMLMTSLNAIDAERLVAILHVRRCRRVRDMPLTLLDTGCQTKDSGSNVPSHERLARRVGTAGS